MIEGVHELMAAEATRKKLREIPGVLAIGYGLKEKDGEIIPEVAYRIYVAEKKPKDQLSKDELIPPTIDGFLTDVLQLIGNDLVPQCCNGPLRPGDQVARYMSDSDEVDSPDRMGTLGCFVQRNGVNYLLSNEHVIMGMISYASDEIYHNKKSRPCGSHCNDPISHMQTNVNSGPSPQIYSYSDVRPQLGVTPDMITFTRVNHHAVQVDCAIGRLEPNVVFTNQTKEYGNINTTIRDITGGKFTAGAPDLPASFPSGTNYLPVPASASVQKRGSRTGHTHGTIIEVAREVHSPANWVVIWEIYVSPTGSNNVDYEVTVHSDALGDIPALVASMQTTPIVATHIPPNKIKFAGKQFSAKGDSGSVVVDDDKKVIGLLWGSQVRPAIHLSVPEAGEEYFRPPTGVAAVTPIAAVFYKLKIDPATAIIPPSAPSAGAILPGAAIIPQEQAGSRMHHRLGNLEKQLQQHPQYGQWFSNGGKMLEEARRLVNHNRRATVVWQRHKGPGFVAAIMSALGEADGVIPKKILDIPLLQLLKAMRTVLSETGSAELKTFLEITGDEILRLAEKYDRFDELIAALSKEEKLKPALK
jgi:hypothetical protein